MFYVSLHFNVSYVIVYFDFRYYYFFFTCFNFSLSHVLLSNYYLLTYFVSWNLQKIEKTRTSDNHSFKSYFWYELINLHSRIFVSMFRLNRIILAKFEMIINSMLRSDPDLLICGLWKKEVRENFDVILNFPCVPNENMS